MLPESKLELHIYSIVLLFCLQNSYSSELSINGDSTSRVISISLSVSHLYLMSNCMTISIFSYNCSV